LYFFFAKQGESQTSGDSTDIPTWLAPREASVLCLSNSKFNKKKGEKVCREKDGGLGQNPQKKKRNRTKEIKD